MIRLYVYLVIIFYFVYCEEILKIGWMVWWCRFVYLMGGDIWVDSEGLGKGIIVNFSVKFGFFEKLSE